MLDVILGLFGTAAAGGLTGLLGMGVKSLFSYLADREKRAQRKDEMAHEQAMRRMDIDAGEKIAERDYRRETEIAAEDTRQESYRFANPRGAVWKFAASLVTLARPAITLYLLTVFTYLLWRLLDGAPIPYVDTPRFVANTVEGVVYLTTTAVTWWFGDRPPQARK